MGTSVTQIDATYGHLVPDSEECLRGLLDGYDDRISEVAGAGSDERWRQGCWQGPSNGGYSLGHVRRHR